MIKFRLLVSGEPKYTLTKSVNARNVTLRHILDYIDPITHCTVIIIKNDELIDQYSPQNLEPIDQYTSQNLEPIDQYTSQIEKHKMALITIWKIITNRNRWKTEKYFDLKLEDIKYLAQSANLRITGSFLRRFGFVKAEGFWYYRFSYPNCQNPIFWKEMNIDEFKLIIFEWAYSNTNTNTKTRMKTYRPLNSVDYKSSPR